MYILTIKYKYCEKTVYQCEDYLKVLALITHHLHEDNNTNFGDSKSLWSYEIKYKKERR